MRVGILETCVFPTSLCERLVSSVLDATEKLTTIHALKDRQDKGTNVMKHIIKRSDKSNSGKGSKALLSGKLRVS